MERRLEISAVKWHSQHHLTKVYQSCGFCTEVRGMMKWESKGWRYPKETWHLLQLTYPSTSDNKLMHTAGPSLPSFSPCSSSSQLPLWWAWLWHRPQDNVRVQAFRVFQKYINSIPCSYIRKLKTGNSKLKVRDVLWPPQSAGRRKNAWKGAHSACLVGIGLLFGHAGRAPGLWIIFSHRCPSQKHVPPFF